MINIPIRTVAATLLLSLAGCSSSDDRLVEFARESAIQQTAQNEQTARVTHELAESRTQQVRMQRDLQQQQAGVNNQRDQLESERREIARLRHRDPVIAAAIGTSALVLASLAPLLLAGYAVHRLRNGNDDDLIGLLIDELASDRPILIPPAVRDRELPLPPQ